MKSIKNQYIALKEGKMTEAQFMRNVRMTLPEYISNVTLFKQAEKILMNKGIISEIKDDSKTGYYAQDGKEQYSKFDELDNMNAQEIMAGYVMEKQDNPNIDIKEAIKVVVKNLKKDQFYYTNYKLTGIRDVKPTEFTSTKRKPFFDQMEELDKKGTNLVDEKNKMQVVKEGLNEAYNDEFSKWRKLDTDEKERISKFVKDTSDRDAEEIAKKRAKRLAAQSAQLSDLIAKQSQSLNETTAEDVKALIDPQTLSKLDIFDRDGETILVYGNYKTIGRDVSDGLKPVYDKYDFYKQNEGDPDGLEYIEYILIPKNLSNEEPKKPSELDSTPIEDVFEGKKDKLKELVRKMVKEMFDGRDNLTDIE
jgi:hypothetical protein